jgi:hypothetical protein
MQIKNQTKTGNIKPIQNMKSDSLTLVSRIMLGMFLLTAGAAQATTETFDWTETGSSFGNAAGTITFNTPGSFLYIAYVFSVQSFSGQFTSGPNNGDSLVLDVTQQNALFFSGAEPKGDESLGDQIYFLDDGTSYLMSSGSIGSPVTHITRDNITGDGGTDIFSVTAQPTPEPGTLGLGALGGLGLAYYRRRK